jgi:steroid 5-alpha reductase family enzyme
VAQLGGVSLWGMRLAYRITSRAVKQGHDDFRYTKSKLQPSFWLEALFKQFIPEAIFQAIISLPFTAPFRTTRVALIPWGWTDIAAVGLFSSGLALETFADAQLAQAKKKGETGLVRSGVWSIVRHPK